MSGAGGGPAPAFRIGSHLPIPAGDSLAKGLTAIILRQGTGGGPLRSPPFAPQVLAGFHVETDEEATFVASGRAT